MTDNTKGNIFDIKKYAIHDGPGIRTTVFFQGCPMDCWWCHNPEGKNAKNDSQVKVTRGFYRGKHQMTLPEIMTEIMKDRVFYEESSGGVTLSGGEPMMQVDFAEGLLQECRRVGIHTCLDTCGLCDKADFERVMPYVNLFLYDLKFINDEDHIKYTGVSNEMILANIQYLTDTGAEIIAGVPMIPGITDTEDNLSEIAGYLSGLKSISKVRLLPYNKLVESKIVRLKIEDKIGARQVQSSQDLKNMAKIFENSGLSVKIGG